MRFHRDEIKNYDDYFDRIGKTRKLTAEEETELFDRYHAGDSKALDTIMRNNMRFVSKIALEYLGYGVSMEDLLSEGNIGLMVAAMKFNPQRGVKFITYAVYWIRDYIKSFVRKSIRITENGYDDVFNDDNKEDSEDFSYAKVDEKPESYSIEEGIVEKLSISKYVVEMLEVLNNKERNVVEMYFGLGNSNKMDLKEISQVIKISKERVRQIIESSIKKMRIAAISRSSFDDDKNII